MTIYLSGAISGLDIEKVKAKFQQAEDHLTNQGWEVVNPLKIHNGEVKTWEQYMFRDIEELFKCDAICMLPCWVGSRGARIEVFIAIITRKKIINERRGVVVFKLVMSLFFWLIK